MGPGAFKLENLAEIAVFRPVRTIVYTAQAEIRHGSVHRARNLGLELRCFVCHAFEVCALDCAINTLVYSV